MITKNYKSIFSYLSALAIGLFMASCDQEENTGLSTFTPSAPTLSVTTSVSSKSLIEDNSEYEFTASLSEAQLVDVKLFISQVDGDASFGSDYDVTGSIVIPAGATSGKGKIKILSDEIIEDTETVKIQIGDNKTSNASISPVFMEFSIMNYTEGDLAIDLSWAIASKTTDNSGGEIGPTDFADMRLLISSDMTNGGDINEADGSGFESLVLSGDLSDGVYYVVADFYDAEKDIIRDLNLDLEFNQAGKINHDARTYSNAISNEFVCESNFYVLAQITKSGDNYEIEDVRINNIASYTINWGGTDVKDYYAPDGWDSKVITSIDCAGDLTISGLNQEWMVEVWGETIEQVGTVYYTVASDGTVTIEEQYIFTTMYSGSLYDYTVSGTGMLDEANGTLYLEYHMFQDGWGVDDYWFNAGGLTTPYFEANLTTN